MTLRLYNTMSRRVEPFTPLDPGRVSFYACGPTVYNYAHIGNFRTFLFEDVLRRWLEASGYEVLHVMNLTDVDDKTIKGALAAGAPLREYVVPFIDAFHEDRKYLRILDAAVVPASHRLHRRNRSRSSRTCWRRGSPMSATTARSTLRSVAFRRMVASRASTRANSRPARAAA